jgi:DNA/RNA-binding domain of Phe-tRNA-synthetase-like protein
VYFRHASEIWNDFPDLVPGVLAAEGLRRGAEIRDRVDGFTTIAESRLAEKTEAELPEIQAWRRAFSRMGLKPTQYRCASESLLRRYRKERALPSIHPLIDLCNAISMAFAIPVAVFDVAKVAGFVEVRYATGSERYASFSGELEHPEPREVIFADGAGRAHARRWTNRQSADSAVGDETDAVLIVAEALHESAQPDVERLVATIAEALDAGWSANPKAALLTRSSARFDF